MKIQINPKINKLFLKMISESTGFFSLYSSILGSVSKEKTEAKNNFLKKHGNK